MESPRSRAALVDFLEYLSRKGLMNKTTATARKGAVSSVLGILDDSEADDVSALDLDSVMTRFHNIHGSRYTPDSLNTYKSRVKSAIEDFLNYVENPLAFRVSAGNGIKKGNEKQKIKVTKSAQPDPGPSSSHIPHDKASSTPFASPTILPIPIRSDLVIYIQGLPYNLSEAEANKIANVVKALAISE